MQALSRADSLLANRSFQEALTAYTELRRCFDPRTTAGSLTARFHRDYGWALARCDSMEDAGKYLARALEEWRAVAGDTSAGYGIALERHARWNLSSGNFDIAHAGFLRSWRILDSALGPDDRETLWAEHGLAQTLERFQRRDEALARIAHVFAVRKRALPPGNLDLAWASHDYAIILHALGRLPEAEGLYRQAFEARRDRAPALFCETGWGYAICLAAEGDYQEALRVMAEVDETLRNYPELQQALAVGTTATAANIAMRLGDYRGAKRLEERFQELVRRYGADQRALDRSLAVRAYILENEGRLQPAIDTLRGSLERIKRTFGAHSPLAVPIISSIASMEVRLGHTSLADSLFRQGLTDISSDQEPALFGSFAADYVRFLAQRGRLSAADVWATAALSAVRALPSAHIVRSKVSDSVGQLRLAQRDPRSAWGFARGAAAASIHRYQLNLQAMSQGQISTYWIEEVSSLDRLLTLLGEEPCRGGPFAEAAWELTMASRGSLLDELTRRREQGQEPDSLRTLRRRLARLLTLDPIDGFDSAPQGQVERTERRIAEIEARLPASRPAAPARPNLDVRSLRSALPPQTTLLAYVLYRNHDVLHYGAFLLPPGAGASFRDLGESGPIDSLIARHSGLMARAHDELLLDPDGAESACREIGASLRVRLLDPLFVDHLPSDLVLIPTGPLWDVNFLTLPRGRESYVVEELASLRLIQSERELVSRTGPRSGGGLTAVGGVDYSRWMSKAPAPLPGSNDEVERVLALWREARPTEPAELLSGERAQEDGLSSRLRGRRVVHLAAHGVAWTDPSSGEGCTGLRLAKPPQSRTGADGVWSEREAALEDLSSVELVFLSSCRSLEGTALSGERLAGLYRAFRLAGARSAVLSAWDVGDRPGRDWCLRFYEHYLKGDLSPSRAAFNTSSEILRERRSTGRPTHPYYWGCFLAVGD